MCTSPKCAGLVCEVLRGPHPELRNPEESIWLTHKRLGQLTQAICFPVDQNLSFLFVYAQGNAWLVPIQTLTKVYRYDSKCRLWKNDVTALPPQTPTLRSCERERRVQQRRKMFYNRFPILFLTYQIVSLFFCSFIFWINPPQNILFFCHHPKTIQFDNPFQTKYYYASILFT